MRAPIALFMLVLGLPGSEPDPLERIGTLEDPALREVSGIVQSRRHPGIFWVHNDSGNPPELFAIKRNGALVRKYRIAVPNIDWEDITIDDSGHLFLGEIGNNENRLPMRAIYRLDEPDPERPSEAPLAVTLSSFYTFPRKGRFDAEGLFLLDGKAMLVAKTFDDREAELYAIPLEPPAPLLRPAQPARAGTLPGLREPVTGAGLSPDGKRLAVCALDHAQVFERAPEGRWRCVGKVCFEAADRGIEAICWDGSDLILAGEGRGIFRIRAATWNRGRALEGPAPPRTKSALQPTRFP